jgi:hypothetical protein
MDHEWLLNFVITAVREVHTRSFLDRNNE